MLEPFRSWIKAPEGVEVVLRQKEGRKFLFVLNFQPTPQPVTLTQEATLLYTGKKVGGEVMLPPYGTAVYKLGD